MIKNLTIGAGTNLTIGAGTNLGLEKGYWRYFTLHSEADQRAAANAVFRAGADIQRQVTLELRAGSDVQVPREQHLVAEIDQQAAATQTLRFEADQRAAGTITARATANAYWQDGYRVYRRAIGGTTLTDLGTWTSGDLTFAAPADGDYELIFRRRRDFCEVSGPEATLRFRLSGGSLVTGIAAAVEGLTVTQTGATTFAIVWQYTDDVTPTQFEVFFAETSPVSTAGDPEGTVSYFGPGAFRYNLTTAVDGYVSVMAVSGGVDGPATEAAVTAGGTPTDPTDEWGEHS